MSFTPLTPQQAFDAALNGIRAQDYRPSVTKYGGCRYRGPDGLKCGVGHAIPDAMYTEKFEDFPGVLHDSAIDTVLQCEHPAFDPLRALFAAVPTRLLLLLQAAHDQLLATKVSPIDGTVCQEAADGWESEMSTIAREFDLVYAVPAKVTA